jgi:hypothetical protein
MRRAWAPRLCLCLLAALLASAPGAAGAQVERFAVVIGNNLGGAGEVPLRYAESDAAKIADVLQEVGGFAPENVIVLRGRDTTSVMRAIIAMNDRIRGRSSRTGGESVLLVFYSGHSDLRALHLAGSRFELQALEQLVRGSAATVRLLILDACYSGALTRVKAGRSAPRMAVDMGDRLTGEGIVFLTSSSASEEAQESDELRGSFFTHYLSSGLLGAADSNQDGVVVLKEAYRHAYENTIRASSRTQAGTQHPTFRYELGGQGDIVLSRLRLGRQRAIVALPPGRGYLLFAHADGSVVAEVGAGDRARTITVRPGRYFVRARGSDYLLEGDIDVGPGDEITVDPGSLKRVDYARLVRKGSGLVARVHGPAIGYHVRTPILKAGSACYGPSAAYIGELPSVRLSARVDYCREQFTNDALSGATDELGISGRAALAWDDRSVTFDIGAAIGYSFLRQTFRTEAQAPDRRGGAVHLEIGGSLIRYLPAGLFIAVEVAGMSYAMPIEPDGSEEQLLLRFAARSGVSVGVQY